MSTTRTWAAQRDAQLTRLWRQPLLRAEIARRMHCSVWSVWHHAKRLKLGMRTGWKRDTSGANEANRQRYKDSQPTSTPMFACPGCGCRATKAEGHDSCQTEAVA